MWLKKMRYEVEQKHRVDDVAALVARLAERGVALAAPIEQSDQYFAHPARDFARTDEALRIRTTGGSSFVTYKGPKVDATTKTRRELELPLHTDDADGSQFAELLAALGFTPVATVRKQRRLFHVDFNGHKVEGALDDVDGVGTFVELELAADNSERATAQQVIRDLADELQLGPSERRSYLELLLAKLPRN
jgi:adenylate cyclase, class 2